MRQPKKAWVLVLSCGLAACTHASESEKKAEAPFALPGDDVVLADVDGVRLTKYDVDLEVRSLFGEKAAKDLSETTRKNVLESLVQMHALARKEESKMLPGERAELERKVASYRVDLLAKEYLKQHTRADGVTEKMVEDYYQAHQADFGGKISKSYDLITTSRELADNERETIAKTLQDAVRQKDWFGWVSSLQKKSLPVAYQHGLGTEHVMHPALQTLIDNLHVGQTSALTFVKGRAYVVRVTAEDKTVARPLSEVSAQIRKTLVPMQLQKSVQAASAVVMKDTKVTYR